MVSSLSFVVYRRLIDTAAAASACVCAMYKYALYAMSCLIAVSGPRRSVCLVILAFKLSPGRGAKYCDCRYVCMSVSLPVSQHICMSARISQKPHVETSQNFRYFLIVPWLGPPLTKIQYVMYFRFCG